MKEVGIDEKTRRVSIAVASWLCGTLEGISCDSADMSLADELDSWLRTQKKNYETLYIGSVVCKSCGKSWECLTLSNDNGNMQCPHCGNIQKKSLILQNQTTPKNREALEKIQEESGNIISEIAKLSQTIKDHNNTIDRPPLEFKN